MSLHFAAVLPPPEVIRQKAGEVVSRSYYDLAPRTARSTGESWLVKFFRWIGKVFKAIFDLTEGLPEILRWMIVIAVVVLCIYLIARIIYAIANTVRGSIAPGGRVDKPSARESDPAELEKAAERARAAGDYIGGVRLLFRAALRRIELFEERKLRPGITNRELLRRYRASPLAGPLLRFVETIDLKWYGKVPCEQADYTACQSEHESICQYASQRQPAHAT